MDRDLFGPHKTGDLVKINTLDGEDWAFVPDPLPPDWTLPASLMGLLGDAKEQLGMLNGIGRTLDDPRLLIKPLQQREAIRSSSLEGTYATPEELLNYELDPKNPESESDRRNAWLEVHNYADALRLGHQMMSEDHVPLSVRLIRETHQRLLRGVRGRDKRPGQFRDNQVHIGSSRRFIPPPAHLVEPCLSDLEKVMNSHKTDLDPLVLAYLVHYQFEAIHPFRDGNGRIGRVLLALSICEWKQHSHPWLYMSAYFDRYKEEYIDLLFRVSTEGAWSEWIEYCLKGTLYQCQDAIRRCDALIDIKREYYATYRTLFHRAHNIIGKLFEFPAFYVTMVADWCGTTRKTAQKDIDQLVECGVLKLQRATRPKIYYAPKIIRAIYNEDYENSGGS